MMNCNNILKTLPIELNDTKIAWHFQYQYWNPVSCIDLYWKCETIIYYSFPRMFLICQKNPHNL